MRLEAANVGEAIKIAREGARRGEWDLFRGQTNSDWQVTSSAERLPDARKQEAFERFKRFVGWAQDVAGMARYLADLDSMWAIAQHYGLQTLFIDFSDDPRVAAFFASDTQAAPAVDQRACIVCLNSQEFQEFWNDHGPFILKGIERARYPSLIRINVDNLWRLQQQKGSFLWNPVVGIERFYDLDRIVFPYVKNDPALPARHEIYPIHQSELEKLLTQFFMDEQMREGNRTLAGFNIPTYSIETTTDDYEARSWWPAGIARSVDWTQSSAWDAQNVEHSSAALPGVAIELSAAITLEEVSKALRSTLAPTFIEQNRARTLDIRAGQLLSADSESADSDRQRLFRCIRRLWNGMRTLPYTPDEICTAIARTIELFPLAKKNPSARQALGEDGLYIEMGSNADGNGAYSRATVTREAFIGASNTDFLSAARKKLEKSDPAIQLKTDAALAHAFLLLAGRPWERLTFSGLRKLMTEQIIPTQIVWRVASDEAELRTVIYFSPVDFKVFGLA
jgi:hypothetical protein